MILLILQAYQTIKKINIPISRAMIKVSCPFLLLIPSINLLKEKKFETRPLALPDDADSDWRWLNNDVFASNAWLITSFILLIDYK